MTIAKKINESMARASWIRKMFEQGALLKHERGAHNVFDFSLGNPCFEPPEEYILSLKNFPLASVLHRFQNQSMNKNLP